MRGTRQAPRQVLTDRLASYAQPCAVAVHVRLHSYDGLVEIDNACLSAPAAYGNGALVIEAIDFGDRVFRGNMEIWP